jgi:hypothetical protein
MPSKTKKAAAAVKAALPSIPKELIDQFVTGPMSAEAVNAASMAFKKALIERALGAERSHHLGYAPGADEFRLTERWTSSAKSVFQLDGQGTVGKSTHAGISWLKWLRDELGDAVHFWPFDGWAPPAGKAVIAEVYPSIFRNRYVREDRSGDEQDAYATARWMSEMSARGALAGCFDPPLAPTERAVAALEGWILGVR